MIETNEAELRGHRAMWRLEPQLPEELKMQLAGNGIMIAHLLHCRGLRTIEAIQDFFLGPPPQHDPMALPDMGRAVERIARAVQAGEEIAVYGDFDCDGLTATVVLASVLRALGVEPHVHVPERHDGHGLNPEAIAALRDRGVQIIITADCGVTAIEEVQVARGMGIDVVITDHHEMRIDGSLPDCPTVNPTRQDFSYPFRSLCGVGVAYKLAQALAQRFPGRYDPDEFLDLVALGTVADVVPLIDENRAFVIAGLERLRRTKRPGLQALFQVAGVDPKRIDPTALGFYLAPRINAANRMASPQLAYELITATDSAIAARLAAQLSKLNAERQILVAERFQEIAAELGDVASVAEQIRDGSRAPVLILSGDWPSGISGLLATRLVETYGLPAFVGADAGHGLVAVSARGVPGVRIDHLLDGCEHSLPGGLFLGYGGHARAGGFRVAGDNFDLARRILEEQAREHVAVTEVGAALTVDARVSFPQLTLAAAQKVRALAPFGLGFPEPLFLARQVMLRSTHPVKEKHVRLVLQQKGMRLDAIAFGAASELLTLPPGACLDIVFHLQINEWNGRQKPELCIRDWRVA